jgi:hypothetical protein
LMVVCGTASAVPVAENVEVDFDFYFVDYFVVVVVVVMVVVVVVVMVVGYLGICGVLSTGAGLDLLQPLLLAW